MYRAGVSAQQVTDPPAVLQVVSHPIRWRLLTELGRSDRRVHELVAATGEPQNLVSYHLGRLRDASLVRSRRSAADGRDTYYAVDLGRIASLLSETGAALHPGLATTPAQALEGVPRGRVLFLCTGNSARSQMAEALTALRSGGRVEARSAGSHPKQLHPNAVRVLHEDHGIDIGGRSSTHVDELAGEHFDRVVTLCDRVREVCPALPGHPVHSHWSLPDPAAAHDPEDVEATLPVFRDVAAQIDTRIQYLLADLARPGNPIPA